jgi:hypothetical protein
MYSRQQYMEINTNNFNKTFTPDTSIFTYTGVGNTCFIKVICINLHILVSGVHVLLKLFVLSYIYCCREYMLY